MRLKFRLDETLYEVDAELLAVVQLIAGSAGFTNVDVEPYPYKVTIKASGGPRGSLNVSAETEEEACKAFVHKALA